MEVMIKGEAGAMRKQAYRQHELRPAAEYRAERLAEALRLVCAEMRLLRDCDQGECGTRACLSPNCMAGPALKLLESLEREVRSGE